MTDQVESSDMDVQRAQINAQREALRQQRLEVMQKRRENRSHRLDRSANKETDAFKAEWDSEVESMRSNLASATDSEAFKNLKLRAAALEEKLGTASRFLAPFLHEARARELKKLRKEVLDHERDVAPRAAFRFRRDGSQSASPNSKSITRDEKQDVVDVEVDIDAKLSALQSNEIVVENRSLATVYFGPDSISGSDVFLSNLTNCTVSIADTVGALRVHNIEHCTLLIGPISSSLHVETCSHSTIHAAMRQCRIHTATDSKFYILCNSEPVIEHSNGLQFAPYCLRYDELGAQLESAQLDSSLNLWEHVKDFNWHRQQASPHWSVLPETDRVGIVHPVEDDEEDF